VRPEPEDAMSIVVNTPFWTVTPWRFGVQVPVTVNDDCPAAGVTVTAPLGAPAMSVLSWAPLTVPLTVTFPVGDDGGGGGGGGGGVGVGVHAVVAVTSWACGERFPAASYATTASV